MGLTQYKRKRHFGRTPEPEGAKALKGGRSFVVQKHRAGRLHYDFRLELDGVLKSWAVPKGPTLDPKVKRLAMQVEDHPVEYGAFEGVIPEGEYGGGTVLLWDRGEWEPLGDPRADYASGKLKFELHGEKLHGRWMLVRIGDRSQYVQQRRWLLFKENDDEEKSGKKADVAQALQLSVVSGRDLDQIAADRDATWSSNGKKNVSKKKFTKRPASPSRRVAAKSQTVPSGDSHVATIRLTSPDKVLYPEQGITKRELANYYGAVAASMLPYIAGRPLVLVRCPDGRHKDCFYQKHPAAGTPDTIRLIDVREKRKTEKYLVVDDATGLVSLAQIGALEIHAWGSTADKLEQPDRLIFDLDPDVEVPWRRVVESTRQVRDFLRELGLESFVKTTGGKGLHLVVPIERRHDWDQAKSFCKKVAEAIVAGDPGRYTANMSKAKRGGKIFVDYLRNGRGATAIAPYSTRARTGAPVSAPLTWNELSASVRPDHYTVRNLPRRLASLKHDPWDGFASVRQSLARAMKTLESLSSS